VTRTRRRIEEHRLGDAVIQVRDSAGCPCPGLPVWVEQETHEFVFGCVVPDPGALPEADRARYRARLGEVFNHIEPAGRPSSAAEGLRADFPDPIHLGLMRRQLEALAGTGQSVDVHVQGQTVGMPELDERESGQRLAELYTLCLAEPHVRGIFWHGFWDGELETECGLLRRDLSPRAVFRILQKLIDTVWHSRASGVTDAEGRFRFRGFFGTYRAGVRAGEDVIVARFSLRQPPTVVIPAGGGR
jgi:hypothetical protein